MTSDATTGLFTAAARVSESVKLGHYALLGALFPALARLQRSNGPEVKSLSPAPSREYRKLLWLLPGFGVLAALLLSFFAEPVIGLLYGPAYAASATALKILVWSLVPYSFSAAVSVHLVASGKERVVAFVTAASLVFLAVSSVVLISRSGLTGASQAVVAAETVQALAYFLYLRIASITQNASAIKFSYLFRRST
jgi:O-antigen/teichoic acid export membrane protein